MLIHVTPYQSIWADQYKAAASVLLQAVGNLVLGIEHIGSTAVENLAAKPIIDIQVSVADLTRTSEMVKPLKKSGFTYRPAADNDRPPPWDSGDPTQWEKAYFRTPTGVDPRIHVHIREVGRRNHRYALLFRDYLRHSERARDSYGRYKMLLSDYVADKSGPGGTGLYLDLKDPVLDLIADAAEQWATKIEWDRETGRTGVA